MNKPHHFNVFILAILFIPIFSCGNSVSTLNDTISQPSDIQLLESIENAFVSVAAKGKPAVVSITAENVRRRGLHPLSPEQKFNRLNGTGFIFRKEGYILTNDHVVNGADQISVRLFDGQEFSNVQLVGKDPSTDIAVLKIDMKEELTPLPFADSDRVKIGQFAIAIGNPFELDYTVTTGIVSGKGRSLLPDVGLIHYQNFIQTDAWINKGNSGGPLLNIHGEVIGINSMIRRPDDTLATEAVRAGAGFAIPINLVKNISEQLITNGQVIRGWLGIFMDAHPDGIRVERFATPSPAKQGGMEVSDLITEYNGERVQDRQRFKLLIANTMVGEKVKIAVLRGGTPKELTITIGKMSPALMGVRVEPDSQSWVKLGITVRDLGAHDFERYAYLTSADQGVIVEDVRIGAPAPTAGVPSGTLILEINGQRIRNMIDYEKVLKEALNASEITFEIKNSYTEDSTETVIVNLDQK